MPKAIGIWRENLKDTATGTTQSQESAIVPPDEQWHLSRVVVRDQTHGTVTADVYIDSGGTPQLVERVAVATANVGAVSIPWLWLREGEKVRVDWASISVADVIEVFLHGMKRQVKQGIPETIVIEAVG